MNGANQDALLLGTCTFDPRSMTLRDAAGTTLRLRAQSMRVLAELVRTRGLVVPRDILIESVWRGIAVTDDSLVQCIKDIRAALSDTDHTILKTVVGQGYAISARTVSEKGTSPPQVCIERFKVASTTVEAEELADALFEDLLIRLAPRAGMAVVTDPSRRMDASYVISGRISARGGKTRIFTQIARSGRGEDIHATMEQASPEDIWHLPGRVADKIASELRVLMIAGDGSEFLARDDAELSVQE